MKKDWLFGDVSLRTNLALYTQDYQGIQRFTSPVSDPSVVLRHQCGRCATINGGELEVTLHAVR